MATGLIWRKTHIKGLIWRGRYLGFFVGNKNMPALRIKNENRRKVISSLISTLEGSIPWMIAVWNSHSNPMFQSYKRHFLLNHFCNESFLTITTKQALTSLQASEESTCLFLFSYCCDDTKFNIYIFQKFLRPIWIEKSCNQSGFASYRYKDIITSSTNKPWPKNEYRELKILCQWLAILTSFLPH